MTETSERKGLLQQLSESDFQNEIRDQQNHFRPQSRPAKQPFQLNSSTGEDLDDVSPDNQILLPAYKSSLDKLPPGTRFTNSQNISKKAQINSAGFQTLQTEELSDRKDPSSKQWLNSQKKRNLSRSDQKDRRNKKQILSVGQKKKTTLAGKLTFERNINDHNLDQQQNELLHKQMIAEQIRVAAGQNSDPNPSDDFGSQICDQNNNQSLLQSKAPLNINQQNSKVDFNKFDFQSDTKSDNYAPDQLHQQPLQSSSQITLIFDKESNGKQEQVQEEEQFQESSRVYRQSTQKQLTSGGAALGSLGLNQHALPSALSIVSRATSNASYAVKSSTGQAPIHLHRKLPEQQKYPLIEEVQQKDMNSGRGKNISDFSLDDSGRQESAGQSQKGEQVYQIKNRLLKSGFSSPVVELATLEAQNSIVKLETKTPTDNQDPYPISGVRHQNKSLFKRKTPEKQDNFSNIASMVQQHSSKTRKTEKIHFSELRCPENTEIPEEFLRQSQKVKEVHIEDRKLKRLIRAPQSSLPKQQIQQDSSVRLQQAPKEHNMSQKDYKRASNCLITHQNSSILDQNFSAPGARQPTVTSLGDNFSPPLNLREKPNNIFGDQWNFTSKDKNLVLRLISGNETGATDMIEDQARLLFNRNPKKGVQFWIEKGLSSDKPRAIAHRLLIQNSGLSKYQIGQYFADPIDFNQLVLGEYVRQFQRFYSFQDEPIDKSFRKFLASFLLPREFQQITRIVEKFADVYQRVNPKWFTNGDQCFQLTILLLQLNMNHNPNVTEMQKTTKERFLGYLVDFPKYGASDLEQIYDRINEEKFRTDFQDVELVLQNIAPFYQGHTLATQKENQSNIREEERAQIEAQKADEDFKPFMKGETFLKYGRWGKPHARFVYISPDRKYLVWCVKELTHEPFAFKQQNIENVQSAANNIGQSSGTKANKLTPNPINITQRGKESKVRRIRLDSIVDIRTGRDKTEVLKQYELPKEYDSLCLSIVTRQRTLDLKCNDPLTRNKWSQFFFEKVLSKSTFFNGPIIVASNRYREYQKAWGQDELQLQEIWEDEILTNIDEHWDFENHRPSKSKTKVNNNFRLPEMVGDFRRQNTLQNLFSCFSCFNSTTIQQTAIQKKDSSQQNFVPSNQSMKKSSSQLLHSPYKPQNSSPSPKTSGKNYLFSSPQTRISELGGSWKFQQNQENPSICLEDLWRFGIPHVYRKRFWPFKCQNYLGISSELYQMLRDQGIQMMENVQIPEIECNIQSQGDNQQQQPIYDAYTPGRQLSSSSCQKSPKSQILTQSQLFEIQNDINTFFQVTQCLPDINQNQDINNQNYSSSSAFDPLTSHFSPRYGEIQRKKNSLLNIILSFIAYRPDTGYIKYMSYLAGTFLIFCPEFEAFVCFANQLHQQCYIQIFQGQIKEIKLRMEHFDNQFQSQMPDLWAHFKALDIITAFFLTDWILTLFVKNIDFKIACRLIDNYLLDGEVFILKAGIAILKYFESRFLKMCHYQIKELLGDMRGQIDEHRLFAIIEDQITFDEHNFVIELKKQKWANDKALLLMP